MISMVKYAHQYLQSFGHVQVAVDFTMGQGNDTVFLSDIADEVYSFDIQETALQVTREKVDEDRVHLILDSHENIDHYLDTFDVGLFNLGYLPGGDHSITTMLDSTRIAVEKAVEMMRQALVIVAYVGHEEGFNESQWLDCYCQALDTHHYNVSTYRMMNKAKAPYIIMIEKR